VIVSTLVLRLEAAESCLETKIWIYKIQKEQILSGIGEDPHEKSG